MCVCEREISFLLHETFTLISVFIFNINYMYSLKWQLEQKFRLIIFHNYS